MNIRAARRLLLCLFLLCAATPLLGQNVTFTSVQSGPWDDPNTWDVGGGQFPSDGSFHHVVIASGHTVTIANSALAADLTFTGGGTSRSVVVSTGQFLTVNGAVTFNDPSGIGVTNTLDVGAGDATVGSVVLTGGSVANSISLLSIGSGTLTVNGGVTVSGLVSNAKITFSGAGTLDLSGSLGNGATLTNFTGAPGSLIRYSGTGAQTVGAYAYQRLILNKTSGTASAGGTLSVAGTFTQSGGVFDLLVASADFFSADVNGTINGTAGIQFTGSLASLSGTGTINAPVTIATSKNISNGSSLNFGTISLLSGVTMTNAGTADVTNITGADATSTWVNNGTLKISGNLLNPTGTLTATLITNTVEYDGTSQAVKPTTYATLALKGSGAVSVSGIPSVLAGFNVGGTTAATLAGALSVAGTVNIGSTASLDLGSFVHSVGGNWTNNGTLVAGTSTVIFNGGSAQNIVNNTSAFASVQFSGVGLKSSNSGLDVDKDFTIASGSNFDGSSFTHKVGGNWTNLGTFAYGTSTVEFDGAVGTQTISGTAPVSFASLTVTNPSGLSLSQHVQVNNVLNIGPNVIATNAFAVLMSGGSSLTRTSGWIWGELKRKNATGSTTFEVGTPSGYSPVTMFITGTADTAVQSVSGSGCCTFDGANHLGQSWQIFAASPVTADLTFTWPAGVPGTEANYVLGRYQAAAWTYPISTVTPATHTGTTSGQTINSTAASWTAGEPSSLGGAPPTVSSFNPTAGSQGVTVILTGTSFTGATAVAFNGTPATFVVDSDTQITTGVPAGATSGTISVTNADGTGMSAGSFTVNAPGVIQSAASGAWTTPATWVGNIPPGTLDQVQIHNTHTVTLTASATCGALTVSSGGTADIGTSTLTVNGAATINGAVTGSGSLTLATTATLDGTGTFAPPVTIQATRTVQSSANLAFNGGMIVQGGATLTNDGQVHVDNANGILGSGAFINGNNATLTVGGPLVPTLTATAPGNSVDYDGGAQTVQATAYHYLFLSGSGTKTMTGVSSIGADLSISGSAVAVAGSGMTISGSVNVNSGSATLTLGSFTHNVAGNWTNNGTVNAAGSVVNFNGSSAQSINGTFANLKINKPSGTATLASSILVTDTTTLTSGVLDIGSNNLTTTDLTGPGALSMGSSGSLSISGDSNTFTGIFIPGTSAVIIDGNGSQLLRGGTYYDLYIQKPTGTATLTAVTTATHKLWVSSGTLADGGNQISSFGSSTLQVDAFATLILGSGAASTSFPGGFTTNTLAPASDVTYAAANSAQQIASFPNYGWLTVDSGGGAGIVKTVDGGAIINAVRLDPTNGAGSLTLDLAGKTANVSGTLGGDGAITFGASTGALNIGGDFANTGAFTRGLSTVTFNGTGNQQVRGVSYHNLTINKVSGFAQLAGATTVFGNLGVTNGTLQGLTNTLIVEGSFSNNGSIDAGSNNWRFRGAVANNGTFTGSTGALVLDGSAPQTWSGSSVASLNNLQMANLSGVTLNKTVSVNGSLDLAGGIITVAGGEQLSMSTAVVTRSAGYVNGALTMNLPNATTRTFHVGTASGYAPVDVLPNGAGLMTVTPKQGPHPNVNTPSVLQRYWTIATTIPTAGVLQFIWNAGEAAGTEASYVTGRYNGGTWAQPGGTVNPTLHFAQISNPSLTGDWTVGEPSAFAGVADLSVGVTSVPPSVLFNQVYNYSVAVNNAGPDPATGVSVNMTLTGDATITGASAPGWACGNTATTATCTLASLATGAPQTITVNTTANASGTGASLAATVTATSIDTNAANDNASAFTSIGPLQADLTLTHVVSGPTSVPPSTLVTFNLSVTNDGSATATNINLTDVLPSGLSYVSNTASGLTCNPVGSNVVCTAPTLLVGNTATAAITVNAVTGGTLTATASVSATEADPNTADNSASAAVTVINVSTLTVESNADSGNFTLRQAILDANSGACVVPCSILFNLPAGQHVIAPTSPFPALTARMFLQAHTQPGYVSAPIVELDGTNAGGIGLQLTANGSQVRGFVIRNFPNAGILVSGGGAVIRDNYLGTDISGTVAAPNTDGVRLTSGTTLIEHNLISGNSGSGIRITGSGSDGNIIQGNFIGTDAGGTINLGNGKGIELGVNPLSTVIGGTGAGERNTIAFNGTGVAVLGSPGNSILANSFYGNTTLGIDLDGDAVANPNDLGDGDGGGNNQQNHPQLVSASIVGANVNVTLQLESSAVPTTQSLLVEVFKAQGSEGKTFLGRQCYGTNDPGTVGLTIPSALVTSGDPIVATATSYQDLACSGTVNDGTSEFSNVVNAVCTPPAATITHAAQVCANSTGNFAAAPAGAASYVWGVTNGTLTGGQGTPNITYDAGPSGSVGLTLTISNGACSSNGSSSVPIAAAITPPTITGPTASCSNSTIALSASAGYATYSWSDGVQVVGTTQNITAQPQVDTTYTLTVSNGAGCTAAATHGVTVTPTGPVVITAPANVNPSSSGNAASVAVRPAGTAYTWSASGGTITGGQGTNAVTFNAGTGSSMTLSITVVQNGCTSTGTKTIAIGQSADLSISKSSDVATVGAGANVTFIIGVTNAGPNASGGLTVTEALPPGTTLVSAAGSGWTFTTLNALTVSASHASINAGAGAEPITVVLTAPNAAGPITNVASVSGGVRDPNIGNNTASATVNVGGGNPNCPTAPPQLMTPAANAVDVVPPVTLGWTPVAGAAFYELWLSLDGSAAQLAATTAAPTVPVNMPGGVTISWFVIARFTSGCTPLTSETRSFTTVRADEACAGNGAATLLAPANDSTASSSLIDFQWTAVPAADGYRLFARIDGGAPQVLADTPETSSRQLIPNGRVEWWVETRFPGCASIDSPHFIVTVPRPQNCNADDRPQLLAPAADLTTSLGVLTFHWSAVPSAIRYELWLALNGGAPSLAGTTAAATITAEVPAGQVDWFVRAFVDRCDPRDSTRRRFVYTPPASCPQQRPLLSAPAEDEVAFSPVDFRWSVVPGGTAYKLILIRTDGSEQVLPGGNAVGLAPGAYAWVIEVSFDGCTPLRSAIGHFVVRAKPAGCPVPAKPALRAPSSVSSNVPYTLRWSPALGAASYVIQEANNAQFNGATSRSVVSREATFQHAVAGDQPQAFYYRVRGVSDCTSQEGAFSAVVAVFILPPTDALEGTAPADERPATIAYRLQLDAVLAGQSFTATPSQPWLSVTPASGVVPAGGQTLDVSATTATLPVGTSLGSVAISLGSGKVAAHGTSTSGKKTVTVNLVQPVVPAPKDTPPPDSLIIPAVAHADGINSRFQSDVRVSNTSAEVKKYSVIFTPSGEDGVQGAQQTTITIDPGQTIALDDILRTWFGSGNIASSTGMLEIRPLTTAKATPTVGAVLSTLPGITTFAASRTFNATATGTFGQYIPAIPYSSFLGAGGNALTLQQIAQSEIYRTNLGLVEGSGQPASLLIAVFGSNGQKLTEFPIDLKGGQHLQLNSFLLSKNIELQDGRVEVRVTSPGGKVTAYASVLDNKTADPMLVTPVSLSQTGNSKYVVPGVADLSTGAANWRTDMRVFNASSEAVEADVIFYSQTGAEPRTAHLSLAPNEVRRLDDTLSSLFGITNDGGALHIVTPTNANLIATARTYNQTTTGTYGQFISAVTPDQAVALGDRALELLQVEESDRLRSNIGIAEVGGKPVKVQVSVTPPDSKVTASTEIELGPNAFKQLPSLLKAVGYDGTYNARVSVKVVEGEGRITAYASVIDAVTQDPTYVGAQ